MFDLAEETRKTAVGFVGIRFVNEIEDICGWHETESIVVLFAAMFRNWHHDTL